MGDEQLEVEEGHEPFEADGEERNGERDQDTECEQREGTRVPNGRVHPKDGRGGDEQVHVDDRCLTPRDALEQRRQNGAAASDLRQGPTRQEMMSTGGQQ